MLTISNLLLLKLFMVKRSEVKVTILRKARAQKCAIVLSDDKKTNGLVLKLHNNFAPMHRRLL